MLIKVVEKRLNTVAKTRTFLKQSSSKIGIFRNKIELRSGDRFNLICENLILDKQHKF